MASVGFLWYSYGIAAILACTLIWRVISYLSGATSVSASSELQMYYFVPQVDVFSHNE